MPLLPVKAILPVTIPQRVLNPVEVRSVTDLYPRYFTFDCEGWLSNVSNFAYKTGDNVAFAEDKGGGTYWVHFCYHSSRGRTAINLTRQCVKALLKDTIFKVLVGLIEEGNRPAKWLIRQVGFRSVGLTDSPNGVCEMFILTNKDLTPDGFFK